MTEAPVQNEIVQEDEMTEKDGVDLEIDPAAETGPREAAPVREEVVEDAPPPYPSDTAAVIRLSGKIEKDGALEPAHNTHRAETVRYLNMAAYHMARI